MDQFALAGSLTPVELGLLTLIGLTLLLPIALALLLERFVYEGEAADPIGFAEYEARFDGGEVWADRLHERED